MFIRNLFRNEIIDEEFMEAVDLFNEGKQEESYDIFFGLWRNTKSPNRKILFQALLQCSAALQLLDRKKYCGAKKVYSCALKKLLNYSTITKPFDIRSLILEMIDYFENFSYDFDPSLIDLPLVKRPQLRKSL